MTHDKARLIALKYALRLEIRGLQRRGPSAYLQAKSRYQLQGNRRQVYAALCEIVEKETGDTGGVDIAMLRPAFEIRNAITDCVDSIHKSLKEHDTNNTERSLVAEFEIILYSALDLEKSLEDAFEFAMGVVEIDKLLTYREGREAKDLLHHKLIEDDADDDREEKRREERPQEEALRHPEDHEALG